MKSASQLALDFGEAQAAREEAIDRVEVAASEKWLQDAVAVIRRVCQKKASFIVDDIWATGLLRKPREPRAMGAALRRAAGLGYCQHGMSYLPSAQPKCHGNPRTVWVSFCYGGRA